MKFQSPAGKNLRISCIRHPHTHTHLGTLSLRNKNGGVCKAGTPLYSEYLGGKLILELVIFLSNSLNVQISEMIYYFYFQEPCLMHSYSSCRYFPDGPKYTLDFRPTLLLSRWYLCQAGYISHQSSDLNTTSFALSNMTICVAPRAIQPVNLSCVWDAKLGSNQESTRSFHSLIDRSGFSERILSLLSRYQIGKRSN
jgi:hypothetical protein